MQISALKVISERENEDKQKSTNELDVSQEPPSLKYMKKPGEKVANKNPEKSPEKNDEDDMLDKALEQIEKENLPLTYEVYILLNFLYIYLIRKFRMRSL